jgi:voltage-gated potassium channel Kch
MKKRTRSERPWAPRRTKLRRFWRDYQWPILLGLELLLLFCGYRGFQAYSIARGESPTTLDILYVTLQLIAMESGALTGPLNWQLEVARLLLPAVTAYTAAAAFAVLFREQVQRISLWFIRDHVVICGLGQKGFLLASRFRDQGARVLCIELDEASDRLPLCRERGALAMVGDATDSAVLARAAVQRARWLIAVCGDDGVNAEIAVAARQLSGRRRRGTLTCIIHIVDPQLCVLLREREIAAGVLPHFRLELFNIFDRGARILLRQHPPFVPPLDPPPHLLVIALGGLGAGLVTYAAQSWRDQSPPGSGRLTITIVDREAEARIESLTVRYPRLPDVCQLIPLSLDVRSPSFQRADFLRPAAGRPAVDRVYICLDNDSLALHAALTLLHAIQAPSPPIVVRMSREGGLATLLRPTGDADDMYRNLHPFSLLEEVCTTELVVGGTHEMLARAAHREYVRHQEGMGQTAQTNPLMVPWEALPEPVRESNRLQVDHIGRKLEAVGHGIAPLTDWDAASYTFSPGQVERMAQMEHERWCQELRENGWTYAPEPKNPAKKTNPALLPWEELPEEEREKNRLAARELPAFLAHAGLQVYPLR